MERRMEWRWNGEGMETEWRMELKLAWTKERIVTLIDIVTIGQPCPENFLSCTTFLKVWCNTRATGLGFDAYDRLCWLDVDVNV